MLGYDLVTLPGGSKLTVDEDEAACVRKIFELYLEHEALIPVVKELDTRGWRTKCWTTRKGRLMGGRPFDKNMLFRLLTNPTYLGLVKHLGPTLRREHDAIVDKQVFDRVRKILSRNGRTGGAHVRNRMGALLKGLVRCVPCGLCNDSLGLREGAEALPLLCVQFGR